MKSLVPSDLVYSISDGRMPVFPIPRCGVKAKTFSNFSLKKQNLYCLCTSKKPLFSSHSKKFLFRDQT